MFNHCWFRISTANYARRCWINLNVGILESIKKLNFFSILQKFSTKKQKTYATFTQCLIRSSFSFLKYELIKYKFKLGVIANLDPTKDTEFWEKIVQLKIFHSDWLKSILKTWLWKNFLKRFWLYFYIKKWFIPVFWPSTDRLQAFALIAIVDNQLIDCDKTRDPERPKFQEKSRVRYFSKQSRWQENSTVEFEAPDRQEAAKKCNLKRDQFQNSTFRFFSWKFGEIFKIHFLICFFIFLEIFN